MSQKVGIIICSDVTTNQVFTSNATLASVGLITRIAANQTICISAKIPITVGATGGVRAQVVVPAGSTLYSAQIKLFNTVAPSITTAALVATAAFTNALANAGEHWLEIEAEIVNGATAGNIDVQLAQNTVDVLSLTVRRGAYMLVIKTT